MILLDSDVVIDVLRQYQPAVEWFNSLDPADVAIPSLAAMELVEGARDLRAQRTVFSVIGPLRHYYADEAVQRHAMILLAAHKLSSGLGLIDALIAATALRMAVPLCSYNVKHFGVVAGLDLRQPYPR